MRLTHPQAQRTWVLKTLGVNIQLPQKDAIFLYAEIMRVKTVGEK